jgi:hypothetical protein
MIMYIVLITSGTKDKVEKASIRVFDSLQDACEFIDYQSYLNCHDKSWHNAEFAEEDQDIFPLIVVPEWAKG